MTRKETVDCDLCGSDVYRPFCIKRGFEYVKCAACKLVYVRSRLAETELGEETERLAKTQHLATAKIESDYSDFIRTVIHEPRLRLMKPYRRNGRMLDIGCGNGAFMYSAEKYGWKAYGVELSENNASYARDKKGLDVRTGTLFDARFPEGHFDVVTLWEVVEHLDSPLRQLREVNRILRTGGAVLLSTPNVNSLARLLVHCRWEIFLPESHLYLFSQRTLKKMLEVTGFRALQLWTEDVNFLTIIRNLRPGELSDNWDEKRRDIVKLSTTIKKHKSLVKIRRAANVMISNMGIGDTLYTLAVKTATVDR
jgi:2-polyprenyl-3-methyl-5-hydroxy-6-metoxy-1,4-benzoquinol methylase